MSELILKTKTYFVDYYHKTYTIDLFKSTISIEKYYKLVDNIVIKPIVLTNEVLGTSYYDSLLHSFVIT